MAESTEKEGGADKTVITEGQRKLTAAAFLGRRGILVVLSPDSFGKTCVIDRALTVLGRQRLVLVGKVIHFQRKRRMVQHGTAPVGVLRGGGMGGRGAVSLMEAPAELPGCADLLREEASMQSRYAEGKKKPAHGTGIWLDVGRCSHDEEDRQALFQSEDRRGVDLETVASLLPPVPDLPEKENG